LPIPDTEVSSSHLGNGLPGRRPPTDLEKSESDPIKKFCALVLSAVMVFITVALSHYKDMKPLYHKPLGSSPQQPHDGDDGLRHAVEAPKVLPNDMLDILVMIVKKLRHAMR
jgi:hypothetical protein